MKARMRLTCNGVIKGLLGKVASLVGRVENLVVEDGEVQRKTETDRVRGREISLRDLRGVLVGLERLLGRLLAPFANRELGKVTVVVALPTASGSRGICVMYISRSALDGWTTEK